MRTTLPCPKCNNEYTAKEILDTSTISWPEVNWIYFKCNACGNFTHIQISDCKMATVSFMGAPGPDWEIIASMEVKDLSTRTDPGFVHVWLEGKHYEYESRK